MQEYFQPKISRKTRIFRLGRKNNILKKKTQCNIVTFQSQLKTKINCISKTEKQVKKGNKTFLFILRGCQLKKVSFLALGSQSFLLNNKLYFIIITTAIAIAIAIITIIIYRRFYSSLCCDFSPDLSFSFVSLCSDRMYLSFFSSSDTYVNAVDYGSPRATQGTFNRWSHNY